MNYNLCDYNVINSLLKKHGFKFSKALGQNFIIDGDICPEMAQALGADKKTGVLEIGPGIGVLTKELCKRAGKVCAVELDKRLYPVLAETLGDYPNFELVEGDIMKLNLRELISEKFRGCSSVKICANLPYYITSPVIMLLLESRLDVDEIVVMVQREAAERLCAEAGTRECGAVSAAVQYYGRAEILFGVGRECFMPSPKVDSAVIRITPYSEPQYKVKDERALFALIKAAFSQRRKTAVNSVSATVGIPKERVLSALESLSLDANIRAEKLTMEDFAKLSEILFDNEG
ncbi:MAG: 16S rRNA (adenine(1518)-N(6)/adenine(1519)-N(6))-dimethyltransferase RsmA [Eubacterium sp.]|nr:16S rRNA (adenine(1518)-N(6)/adenine(1519)-N(6))-dimethyltransferase RsmA [Eubacterium sp.]